MSYVKSSLVKKSVVFVVCCFFLIMSSSIFAGEPIDSFIIYDYPNHPHLSSVNADLSVKNNFPSNSTFNGSISNCYPDATNPFTTSYTGNYIGSFAQASLNSTANIDPNAKIGDFTGSLSKSSIYTTDFDFNSKNVVGAYGSSSLEKPGTDNKLGVAKQIDNLEGGRFVSNPDINYTNYTQGQPEPLTQNVNGVSATVNLASHSCASESSSTKIGVNATEVAGANISVSSAHNASANQVEKINIDKLYGVKVSFSDTSTEAILKNASKTTVNKAYGIYVKDPAIVLPTATPNSTREMYSIYSEGDIFVEKNAAIEGTATVAGNATVQGDLDTQGRIFCGAGDVTINDNFKVIQNSAFGTVNIDPNSVVNVNNANGGTGVNVVTTNGGTGVKILSDDFSGGTALDIEAGWGSGIYVNAFDGPNGMYATSYYGTAIIGDSTNNTGVMGTTFYGVGVYGDTISLGAGVAGVSHGLGDGVYGNSLDGYAVNADGQLRVAKGIDVGSATGAATGEVKANKVTADTLETTGDLTVGGELITMGRIMCGAGDVTINDNFKVTGNAAFGTLDIQPESVVNVVKSTSADQAINVTAADGTGINISADGGTGININAGNWGTGVSATSNCSYGVLGNSTSGSGVRGTATTGFGVSGYTTGSGTAVSGVSTSSGYGVYGKSYGGNYAVYADGNERVIGGLDIGTTSGAAQGGIKTTGDAEIGGNLTVNNGVSVAGGLSASSISADGLWVTTDWDYAAIYGIQYGYDSGVYGDAYYGTGVRGVTETGMGVFGQAYGNGTAISAYTDSGTGVRAQSDSGTALDTYGKAKFHNGVNVGTPNDAQNGEVKADYVTATGAIYGATVSSSGTMYAGGSLTVTQNTTLGVTSANTINCVGRWIPRSISVDPTVTATAGSRGEIVLYNDNLYLKTVNTGTNTNWKKITL